MHARLKMCALRRPMKTARAVRGAGRDNNREVSFVGLVQSNTALTDGIAVFCRSMFVWMRKFDCV